MFFCLAKKNTYKHHRWTIEESLDLKESQVQGRAQHSSQQSFIVDNCQPQAVGRTAELVVGTGKWSGHMNARGKPIPSGRRTTSCPKLVRLRHMKLGRGTLPGLLCDSQVISLTYWRRFSHLSVLFPTVDWTCHRVCTCVHTCIRNDLCILELVHTDRQTERWLDGSIYIYIYRLDSMKFDSIG